MSNMIILCIASMFTYISKEIVYPILPLYMTTSLGITPTIVGLVEGISKSLTSIVKFYSGYFSDKRNSRKNLVIIGYFGELVHKVLLFFSNGWLWVLSAKIIERFGKGVRLAPRDAMIAESGIDKGVSFGFQRTFDKIGAVIGITIVYLLTLKANIINYKLIFLISIIPAFIGFILLLFLKKNSDRGIINVNLKRFDQKIKLLFIIIFISSLGNSTKSFLLLKATDNGFNFSSVIFLYLLTNITTCFLAYPVGKLCDKISKKIVIFSAYLLFGCIYLMFALTKDHSITTLLFILYGVYVALISISTKAFITNNAPFDMKATALGVNECLIGLASLPATIMAGFLWTTFSSSTPFLYSSIIGFISALLICFI